MKTVKDYICELNATELVDTFFEEYGEDLYNLYYRNNPNSVDDLHIDYDESVRDLSVFDYAQAERKKIYDLIKYLKDIEITECSTGKTGIVYAYSKYDEDVFKRWKVRMLFKEELLSDPENCKNRHFVGVRFSEVLGFLVADNSFTQEIIYKVIADVLDTATYTGYRQEYTDLFLGKCNEHPGRTLELYAPIDEGSLYFINAVPGINFNETAESQKRLTDVRKAICEYEMFTMYRERNILLKSLMK